MAMATHSTAKAVVVSRPLPTPARPAMLTMGQLCEWLNCHRSTVLAMIKRGVLPTPFKLSAERSGQLRFDADEVGAAISKLRITE